MVEINTIETTVNVNDVDIAYQLHGNANNPTIMLIHGLGAPLSAWPKAFVEQLVLQGFQVLLLDNRDVGKSAQLEHLKMPNLPWLMLKLKLGLAINVPYKLEDMMNDTVALLDHLQIDKVHLVGASMGGMIAQLITINYPHRVHTLTSMMSTTGNKKLPKMTDAVKQNFAEKPASYSAQDILKFNIKKWQVIGSPGYPSDAESLTEFVIGLLERGMTAKGTLRQMLAVMATKNREKDLAKIATPTLVLHGDDDPLIRVECGIATASVIPSARLKTYPGMGHDCPIELIPSFVEEIISHTNTVASQTSSDTKEITS
ncbi:alpha/beta fold hydrolase [Thalassotalea crassostreae]|uniref:alpha/beta fold hydrolase n=1 Tax=Thalassotalea crassostreae TaxID=1763536 RepID=UPI000837C6EE|nr:alpha/beta hydrolase [Thalassotalea crassostreae]